MSCTRTETGAENKKVLFEECKVQYGGNGKKAQNGIARNYVGVICKDKAAYKDIKKWEKDIKKWEKFHFFCFKQVEDQPSVGATTLTNCVLNFKRNMDKRVCTGKVQSCNSCNSDDNNV